MIEEVAIEATVAEMIVGEIDADQEVQEETDALVQGRAHPEMIVMVVEEVIEIVIVMIEELGMTEEGMIGIDVIEEDAIQTIAVIEVEAVVLV